MLDRIHHVLSVSNILNNSFPTVPSFFIWSKEAALCLIVHCLHQSWARVGMKGLVLFHIQV
jgi:hypothetical protein